MSSRKSYKFNYHIKKAELNKKLLDIKQKIKSDRFEIKIIKEQIRRLNIENMTTNQLKNSNNLKNSRYIVKNNIINNNKEDINKNKDIKDK